MFLGPGEIKYYKNSFKSIPLIYAICNHRRTVRVIRPLPQRFLECRKVGVRESLKMTDGMWVWLRSVAAGKKDLEEGQITCCALPWGLCKLALGRAASASTDSCSPRALGSHRDPAGSAGTGQRPGPRPAPHRREPAPLRGLCKLRPLEVSRQPPDLLPGVRHHYSARPDTGKRQTRQPSAGRRHPERAAPRAKRPASGKIANRNATAEVSALSWAWPAGSGIINAYEA